MNSILNFLNGIIDRFIPDHMREDIGTEKRVRMFLLSHLLGPFMGMPLTLYLMAYDPAPYPHVYILGASLTVFWLFPVLLKMFPKRYNLLAYISVQNLSFAILWGSYHYGGAQSPFLMWYLVLPLLAFFYLGSGFKTSMAIYAQIITGLAIFSGVYYFGGTFPLHIPLTDMTSVSMISAISASTYIFFMASYYATVVDSQSEFLKEIARHQETLAKLTHAKDDAEEANSAKSEFLAKMSHELRTPLNAVLGYSEILLEDAELDGRGGDIADLQKISAAGKHLLSMVNDILDISKIEAGKTDIYHETIDFDELIDEVEATARPLAAKNTNKFIVTRDENLGELYLDGTKLRQAIYNLLSNASKFTQNGEITLNASRYTIEGQERFQVSITDTGVGISEEGQKKLFSNFAQADASITAKFGGTGLGLSLSQNLCELMGGNITVESEAGVGSCFTIDLPVNIGTGVEAGIIGASSEKLPMTESEASSEDDEMLGHAINDLKAMSKAFAGDSSGDDRRLSKGKILVVDDDRPFLELTERLLTKEGYGAIVTDAPESVLQLARTVKPKAIFVDVMMPTLDGWDVINMLKSDLATRDIPIFMLSILEERAKAEAHNANGFILKPLDSHKIKKALGSIDDGSSKQGQRARATS